MPGRFLVDYKNGGDAEGAPWSQQVINLAREL